MAEYRHPLISGNYYHVFNRGIDKRNTFYNDKEFNRFRRTLYYYNFKHTPTRFSYYVRRQSLLTGPLATVDGPQLTSILAFCLMPNHYHLLLRQDEDGGICRLISQLENSYTKHFNNTYGRSGNLFMDRFRVVPITSEWQLHHVSRYIHLNPYVAGIVSTPEQATSYPYSSFLEYDSYNFGETISRPSVILNSFGSSDEYRQFVLSRAPIQRTLKQVEHATQSHQ